MPTSQYELAKICKEIERQYAHRPKLILSEDDIKCILFSKLLQSPIGIISPESIHSEIKFFDKNNKLTIRPDITIMHPECITLQTNQRQANLSRKGFLFTGDSHAIEIKFCKNINGISPHTTKQIHRDISKLKELKSRLYTAHQNTNYNMTCSLIIVTKFRNEIDDDKIHLLNNTDVEIIHIRGAIE